MSRIRRIFPRNDLPLDVDGRLQWRAFLTPEERAEQEKLEERAREIDAERRAITARVNVFRDRCNSRRLYHEQLSNEAAA